MLAKIERTYLQSSGAPYVNYIAKVTVGLSDVTLATLYSDTLPNPTVLARGFVRTNAFGKILFYVKDEAEYMIQLIDPNTQEVLSIERRVDAKSVKVFTPELTDSDIIFLQSIINTGAIGNDLIQFQDESANLGSQGTVNVVNFTGTAVQATRVGNVLTVDVTPSTDGQVTSVNGVVPSVGTGNVVLSPFNIGAAPAGHQHVLADVPEVQVALDTKAPLVHQHVINEVQGLSTALGQLQTDLNTKAALGHTHVVADIVNLSGLLSSFQSLLHWSKDGVALAGPVSNVDFIGDGVQAQSSNGTLTITITRNDLLGFPLENIILLNTSAIMLDGNYIALA